ncbi:unnamed protein product, partial [Meganyctiphanes norvegica]
ASNIILAGPTGQLKILWRPMAAHRYLAGPVGQLKIIGRPKAANIQCYILDLKSRKRPHRALGDMVLRNSTGLFVLCISTSQSYNECKFHEGHNKSWATPGHQIPLTGPRSQLDGYHWYQDLITKV